MSREDSEEDMGEVDASRRADPVGTEGRQSALDEVRRVRLERLRRAVVAGTYRVDSLRIADKLLDRLFLIRRKGA